MFNCCVCVSLLLLLLLFFVVAIVVVVCCEMLLLLLLMLLRCNVGLGCTAVPFAIVVVVAVYVVAATTWESENRFLITFWFCIFNFVFDAKLVRRRVRELPYWERAVNAARQEAAR